MNDINKVRQVLMNELGFTRDEVRAEMARIVEVEAVKAVNTMLNNGALDQLVSKAVNSYLTGKGWTGRETISEIVSRAAQKAAEKFVVDNLTIKGKLT